MTSDIKVRLENGIWINALWHQLDAFKQFKTHNNFLSSEYELTYSKYGYNFKIKKINRAIYLIRENGTKMPICDWHNVKVFLTNQSPVNWYAARYYQIWSYYDFIYNEHNLNEKKYYTKGSNSSLFDSSYVEIPIDGVCPNIVFKIIRNETNRIFYVKNDIDRTMVRMSDNDDERLGYLGFYHRMTALSLHCDDIIAPIQQYIDILDTPNMINILTFDESNMCTICHNYKKNIIFKPCNHDLVCSYCAKQILEHTKKLDCPTCRTSVTSIDKIKPINWFDAIFGFIEQDYSKTKNEMLKLYLAGKNKYINEVEIGDFMLLDLEQLYTLCTNKYGGTVKFKHIVANIKEIHKSSNNDNATIQVASQFNCLEMIDYNKSPEHGITCYENDKTQGPICVMCTPTGLAYRNYIYNGGQNKNQQINMSDNLLTYFKLLDNSINWTVKNGYLMIDDVQVLLKISKLLKNNDIRKTAKNKIKAGIHTNIGVFIDETKYCHTVNHVLCSGLPISYHQYPLNDINLWDGLSELFLEAYYEITLLMACVNNMMKDTSSPCYLTQIGGGVFGMKKSLINKAITNACNLINSLGHNLDVFMVHYGSIDQSYCK